MNQNYLNALQKKLSVLVLTLILTATLPGLVLAMDLGAQLGGLQTKLVGLKGKLGQLKGGLEDLKGRLDGKKGTLIDEILKKWVAVDAQKIKNTLKGLGMASSQNQRIAQMQITEDVITLLKKKLFQESDVMNLKNNIEKLYDFATASVDRVAELDTIQENLKLLKEIIVNAESSSSSGSDSGSDSNSSNLGAAFNVKDFLIKSLGQDTPTQAEFNNDKKMYINTFFNTLAGHKDENINKVIAGLEASIRVIIHKSNALADKNNATFSSDQELANFFHATYLNKIFDDSADAYPKLQAQINANAQKNLLTKLMNEYEKLYKSPGLAQQKAFGINKGKTDFEIKESTLEIRKNSKNAKILDLINSIKGYHSNNVNLNIVQINALLDDDKDLKSLKTAKDQEKKDLHQKADELIKHNLNTNNAIKTHVKTKKNRDDLSLKLKKHGCDKALAVLNQIITDAEQKEKALKDQKDLLIGKIQVIPWIAKYLDDKKLRDATKEALEELLNKLQGSGNAGDNAAGGASDIATAKAALDAIINGKRPPGPPPPPPLSILSWPLLTNDEIDTIITNKNGITKPINGALKALVERQKSEFYPKRANGLEVLKELGISP